MVQKKKKSKNVIPKVFKPSKYNKQKPKSPKQTLKM